MDNKEEKKMEPSEKTTGVFLSEKYKKEYLVEVCESTEAASQERAEACANDNYNNFTCSTPGENSFATNAYGLTLGNFVTINSSYNLENFIRFNDYGCVYRIVLLAALGPYQYKLEVEAEGPMGLFSGSGYLYFTDRTGDTYSLSIWDSSRKTHTLLYNSDKPEITTITWSNHSR